MTKRYRDLSDSQANAEALYRRDHTWTEPSQESFRVNWDWRKRQPKDLREAVRIVRAAYASEVPTKLHDGPDAIGEGGTPRMTARAEGYIFGSGMADDAPRDAETGQRDPIGYYHAPFRARLAELLGNHAKHPDDFDCQDRAHRQGAIVQHIAFGTEPVEAAMAEGVPLWCALHEAKEAVFFFIHSMSDLRLHLSEPLAESVTAA